MHGSWMDARTHATSPSTLTTMSATASYSWIHVILFDGHTGSTALNQQLGWHPQINATARELSMCWPSHLVIARLAFQTALEENLAGRRVATGFKLRICDGNFPDEWRVMFHQHRTRLLLMFDDNPLLNGLKEVSNRQVWCRLCKNQSLFHSLGCQHCGDAGNPSSLQFFLQSGLLHAEQIEAMFPVPVSLRRLLFDAGHTSARTAALLRRGRDMVPTGEDVHFIRARHFLADASKVLHGAIRHIGVDSRLPLSVPAGITPFKRPSSTPICDRIANWNHGVCDHLAGCVGLAGMFKAIQEESSRCVCKAPTSCLAESSLNMSSCLAALGTVAVQTAALHQQLLNQSRPQQHQHELEMSCSW